MLEERIHIKKVLANYIGDTSSETKKEEINGVVNSILNSYCLDGLIEEGFTVNLKYNPGLIIGFIKLSIKYISVLTKRNNELIVVSCNDQYNILSL